jgi:hypothetical protein
MLSPWQNKEQLNGWCWQWAAYATGCSIIQQSYNHPIKMIHPNCINHQSNHDIPA